MASFCIDCGKKLGLLDDGVRCSSCSEELMKNRERKKILKQQVESEKQQNENVNLVELAKKIYVTTCDEQKPYHVICPIICVSHNMKELEEKYADPVMRKMLELPETEQANNNEKDTFLSLTAKLPESNILNSLVEGSDKVYYLYVAEMRLRAAQLGGDAVIGMRFDKGMYGTVIKFIEDER